jgi:hypothetical protein
LGEYQLADCVDSTNFKLGRESGPGELVHPNNSIITFNSLPKHFSKTARHRHLRRLTREGFRTSLNNNDQVFFKYYFLLFFVKVVRIVENIQHFSYVRTPFLLESGSGSLDQSPANKSHIPSTVPNSTVTALLNPELGVYELASAIKAEDYITYAYMSSVNIRPLKSCPVLTLPINSNLRFKQDDLQVMNSLNILSSDFLAHNPEAQSKTHFKKRLRVCNSYYEKFGKR